jgi:periplasmic protein TonB
MLNKHTIMMACITLLAKIKSSLGTAYHAVIPPKENAFSAAGIPVSKGQEYIGNRQFGHVVMVALLLHALAFYIWHLSPKTQVVDIPVRALNIKLGDVDISEAQLQAIQPSSANSKAVENTLSKLVEGVKMREDAIKPVEASEKSIKEKMAKPSEDKKPDDYLSKISAPKQFIRNTNTAAPAQKIVPGTSTASDAEIMRRYEQVISLWIKKFKLYPDEARNQGMEGETVVRIRIDRRGNIKYCALERSTGYQILDHAAIAMIKRANPVPAVPHDYPPGDQMEFLIPVNFHLK